MNTDLENKIGVGSSDYPFPAQKEGQCLVSNIQKNVLGLEKNQLLTVQADMGETLTAMVIDYNQIAKEQNLEEVP